MLLLGLSLLILSFKAVSKQLHDLVIVVYLFFSGKGLEGPVEGRGNF